MATLRALTSSWAQILSDLSEGGAGSAAEERGAALVLDVHRRVWGGKCESSPLTWRSWGSGAPQMQRLDGLSPHPSPSYPLSPCLAPFSDSRDLGWPCSAAKMRSSGRKRWASCTRYEWVSYHWDCPGGRWLHPCPSPPFPPGEGAARLAPQGLHLLQPSLGPNPPSQRGHIGCGSLPYLRLQPGPLNLHPPSPCLLLAESRRGAGLRGGGGPHFLTGSPPRGV